MRTRAIIQTMRLSFSIQFIFVLAILVGVVGIPLLFAGQNNNTQRGEERKIVAAGEVLNRDYVAAGETIEIAGTVNGDVYIAGGQILINGEINGDLLAIGATISISGKVSQNVRVIGGQVIISGEIGRNVSIGGINIELTNAADIQGGVVIGGANIFLASPIEKDVRVGGRNLTIGNAINGNIEAAVESVRLTSEAAIAGDFTYWSNKEASLDKDAKIEGAITRKAPQGFFIFGGKLVSDFFQAMQPFFAFLSLITTLVLGFLFIRFFPAYTRAVVDTLSSRRWRSFTTGITTLVIIPILFGLLIITIVGIPLGLILLTLSSFILYVARIFVIIAIGTFILKRLSKTGGDFLAFLIGLIVYSVLVLIPIIGWIVPFFSALFGLGAAVQTFKDLYVRKKKNKEHLK